MVTRKDLITIGDLVRNMNVQSLNYRGSIFRIDIVLMFYFVGHYWC